MSQIDELRRILSGHNAERIDHLLDRIEDLDQRTRDVAEVLPPAIEAQISESNRLVEVLKQPVSEGLKQAIESDPAEYAEILYPVMAPSIRRAISQAISSLLVTINQTVESATSAKGIGLRIQSWRSGVPYAELALRSSLLYRVEHVYLIHRDTGLLISECTSHNSESLDSDAVSAMFSAIQSFVQDSFSNNEQDRLTDMTVGEHNVWVAHGPHAMLACVIYGDAPESLKQQLYDALDEIRTGYAQQLSGFSGDESSLSGVQEKLEPLLQLRLKEDELSPNKPSAFTALFGVVAIIALAYLGFKWFDGHSKLQTTEYYLKQTPGIVVTQTYWQDGKIIVEGLHDPRSQIPENILKAYGIDQEILEIRTKPYQSLELLSPNQE